jgi:hypothetical protein
MAFRWRFGRMLELELFGIVFMLFGIMVTLRQIARALESSLPTKLAKTGDSQQPSARS